MEDSPNLFRSVPTCLRYTLTHTCTNMYSHYLMILKIMYLYRTKKYRVQQTYPASVFNMLTNVQDGMIAHALHSDIKMECISSSSLSVFGCFLYRLPR